MEQNLYRHKNITEPNHLSGYFFHINIQLLCRHKNFFMQAAHFQCGHNHLKSICFEGRASTRSGANVHYLLDRFHVETWLRCDMTCWVGYSHSSYPPATFLRLALCESKGEIFLICDVTTGSICYVTLWMGSHHPKSPP